MLVSQKLTEIKKEVRVIHDFVTRPGLPRPRMSLHDGVMGRQLISEIKGLLDTIHILMDSDEQQWDKVLLGDDGGYRVSRIA